MKFRKIIETIFASLVTISLILIVGLILFGNEASNKLFAFVVLSFVVSLSIYFLTMIYNLWKDNKGIFEKEMEVNK
jgi:ABC-type multidrug transport system permease subunit